MRTHYRESQLFTSYSMKALSKNTVLYQFGEKENSSLIVREGQALLIDCHSSNLGKELSRLELPQPNTIIHTHIQEEHTQEGNSFPKAITYIPEQLAIPATDPKLFKEIISQPWQDPEAWLENFGRETFDIGGRPLVSLPPYALSQTKNISAGQVIKWNGLELEAFSLPGHGLYALGFVIKEKGAVLAYASADTLMKGARMPNHFDIQVNYSDNGIVAQRKVLTQLASLEQKPFITSTGPLIENGPAEALELVQKIDAYLESITNHESSVNFTPMQDKEAFKGYIEVAKGIYQDTNFGNMVIFISDEGDGLIVDPGPCAYDLSPDERKKKFFHDLDTFERDFGLKQVSMALLTHFHGDHIDFAPYLEERYGAEVVTTIENADIINHPSKYNFSCNLPWYGFGISEINISKSVKLEETFHWGATAIIPVSLPTHCQGHCGFLLHFGDEYVACTGDAIQSRGSESTDFNVIPSNGETRKGIEAFVRLEREAITLNCGGHGSHFRQCKENYRDSIKKFTTSTPLFNALFFE